MSYAITSFDFHRALYLKGLLPTECVSAELITPIDGVLQMRYVVNVTQEEAVKIAEALVEAYGPRSSR